MDGGKVKIKSEGAKHCCYGTCNSDSRYRQRESMDNVFFIPFPKPITQMTKCEKWIKACGRTADDFNVEKIKRCTYICSKHFVGGNGPTLEHPDPIPALLHTDEQVSRFKRKRKLPTPRKPLIKIRKTDEAAAAEALLELQHVGTTDNTCTLPQQEALENKQADNEKAVQTDNPLTQDQGVQTIYENVFLNAKIENMILKNKMKTEEGPSSSTKSLLSLKSIKNDDAKIKLFTGLSFYQFKALFEFLGESVNNLTYWDGVSATESTKKGKRKLEPQEELFLTLVRLRRGYNMDSMAHFFGLSASTISVIFTTWIQLLFCHFNDLRSDMFPERQHFKEFLPKVFSTFKNIRCTIDCTEFFVQMPRDFKRQGNLYSSYKNHHTYKCLVGVAPNGSIVYVSDIYEGSISDRAIVEKCGFLDTLNPGDLVLADRGFLIEDLLLKKGASLNIPPFLGKRAKFTAQEELKTRRIVYVSDIYEGSISDRAIVEKCGFLDTLNPGDLVLADRGFLIEDLLLKKGASLNIPPFLGKRAKFTAQEELKTRRIAKARIHVERVIERIKKFKLLSGNIPLSLSPISNQLVFVACCLVNFQEPLVK